MGSKMAILILGILAMLLLISSEVAARNLKEGEVVEETNEVDDAKIVGGDFPGGGIPRIGGFLSGGGGGYDYGNAGGGGPPTYGFGAYCMYGCCFRTSLGGCLSCCQI